MVKKSKKKLGKLVAVTFGGATALQGVEVLKARGDVQRLAGTVPGFIGIGVAGAAAKVASNLILMPKKRKKRRK